MTDEELKSAVDGLIAYDHGAVDSGIHDLELKAKTRVALIELMNRGRTPYQLVSDDFSKFVRDLCLSDEAISRGYGLEDFMGLMRWLENEMEIVEF